MQKAAYEFISKQTNDPIVEWKTCEVSGESFAIFKSDLEFYEKISPTFNGEKYPIPRPTLCPEERERRRLAWRNERKLYRRTCDKTGTSIVSIYPKDSEYTVYDRKVWYSDEWDAMDYSREYNFDKTFFENLDELNKVVPKKGLHTVESMDNCHYCNYGIHSKDCYMCMGPAWAENCLYGWAPVKSVYDVDGFFNVACQQTYQCIHCVGCFECSYCDHSNNCKFSSFLSFCNNCDYCLGCVNLQTARYCILNKQYTEEEYEKLAKEILKDRESICKFKKEFKELTMISPRKGLSNINAENSIGNYLQNNQNNIMCYINIEGANNKYTMGGGYTADPVYDAYAFTRLSYCFEVAGLNAGAKSAFILTGEDGCNECYYCQHINNCEHCFGCIGIKNKKYCILNKQYTKEEYEKLVSKIIKKMQKDGERGEFFPISLSTFGYNETIAQNYYPMTKEETISRGYKRQDQEYFVNIPEGLEQILGKNLPVSIQDVGDDILEKVIVCETTGKPFRIIKQELDFYRKHNISIPTEHQDVRKKNLLQKRLPKAFHIINCDECKKETLSAYPADSEYKVYCESCYNKEIY